LSKKVRMAGPGEFTARSYLNGRIDLSQAEAVNEIITCSNKFQLSAAQRLLAGRLARQAGEIRDSIVDCLSLIEAGLDFSGKDIEFITCEHAVDRLTKIKEELEKLLAGSISCETLITMPAVGIAGAPNAGKSSLLNKLLGKKRSIVSAVRKTTRDVLTGLYEMDRCRCVLFDCAGLVEKPKNILDELAQSAAVEALQNSSLVVFCVDVSKDSWQEDITIRELISPEVLIATATKSDLLSEDELAERIKKLNELFGSEFLTTSIKTNIGLSRLRDTIDTKIIEIYSGLRSSRTDKPLRAAVSENVVALTARHKQAVTDAIECIGEAAKEVKAGNDEIAAMLLRTAIDVLSDIEHQHIDEQVLENIFSHFCIGK